MISLLKMDDFSLYQIGAEHELCQVRGQCYANFDNIVWAVRRTDDGFCIRNDGFCI